MPLRGLNNPQDIYTVMQTLQALLPVDPITLLPNTVIGQNQQSLNKTLIYIQQAYAMVTTGIFPAILIDSGRQIYKLIGRALREGEQHINIGYFDRWDQSTAQIDTINANNSMDLARICANLENNDTLTFQGANYLMSIPTMTLSGYRGSIDNTTIPGFEFVRHDLDIVVEILPYSC